MTLNFSLWRYSTASTVSGYFTSGPSFSGDT
jgi:hypothetical protein